MPMEAPSSSNKCPEHLTTDGIQMPGGTRSSTPPVSPELSGDHQLHYSAPSQASSSSDSQYRAVEIPPMRKQEKVLREMSNAASPTVPRDRDEEQLTEPQKVLQIQIPSSSDKEVGHRLVNFLGEYKSLKAAGGRNYDYIEKYDEDNPGEETGPDARIFKVYNDEAEKYDDDMIRGLTNSLDALLVFASLFSAVVTTFLVQSSQAFETDQAMVTNYLLIEQIQLLRVIGNSTAVSNMPPPIFSPKSRTFEDLDILVNGLFVASLALSLATALLSVIAKQWLQAYMAVTSGSARDIAMIRQLRFNGFMKWKMHELIGVLPLILHASLGIFSTGLIVFLHALYSPLSWIVVGILGLVFSFYLASIILPAVDLSCPYRIPVLYGPSRYGIHIWAMTGRLLKSCFAAVAAWLRHHTPSLMIYHLNLLSQNFIQFFQAVIVSFRYRLRTLFSKVPEGFRYPNESVPQMPSPLWSLKSAEASQVREDNIDSLFPLIYEGIIWLHDMSSNTTVRRIAAWSFAGTHFDWNSFPLYTQPSYVSLIYKSSVVSSLFQSLYESTDLIQGELGDRASEKLRHFFHVLELKLPPPQVSQTIFPAVRHGRTKYISNLLGNWKVDANSIATESEWPGGSMLTLAAYFGYLETARMLLSHGADVNVQGGFLGSALQAASERGHLNVINLLLDHGADVHFRGGNYGSALQAASLSGSWDVVKLLLDHGADVHFQGGDYGSALQAASLSGSPDVIKVLLDHGADVNIQGGVFGSALQAATQRGHLNVFNLLLDHGADVNLQGGLLGSALQGASLWGSPDVVKLLLDHGADVNMHGGEYGSALQAASFSGSPHSIIILLNYGANVNAQGGKFGSALQAATQRDRLDVIKLLLDHGADVNLKGGVYDSALQVATKRGYLGIVKLLRDNGAV